MTRWPVIPLKELVQRVERAVRVEADGEYPMLGVRSFGAGAFAAGTLRGSDTKYPVLHQLHAGDFVYPKLMAWEGAFALTPRTLDRHYVSPEFCSFIVDRTRLLPEFLDYYFRRPITWRRVVALSSGTNVRRRRLHPDEFLAHGLPLPPLPEQSRIVTVLDASLSRIESIHQLSERTAVQGNATWWSIISDRFRTLARNEETKPLAESVDINPESVNPAHVFGDNFFEYVDIGAVGNGAGTLRPKHLCGIDAPSRARRRIRADDVLVSTVRPYLRGVALIPSTLDGQVCSTGFAVLRPRSDLIPAFLFAQATSDYFIDQLTQYMKGGHYPAVNDSVLRNVELVVPPRSVQEKECDALRQLETRMRRIISIQDARIERLKQLGSSVIEHVVIRAGL